MRRVLILLMLLLPATAIAQEADSVTISFPGGWIKVPGIVSVPFVCPTGWTCYEPGEEPTCPDCPPPPAWECPEGWECIPPPEPEPTVELVRQDSGVVAPGGSVRVALAMDTTEAARTRVVEFFLNGVSVRNEYAYRYCLGGGDGVPCNPQTIPTDAMEAVVEAKRYLRDGSPVETYTLEIPVNPNVPPEPPDSTPPTPPDTTPTPPDSVGPTPGDTIIGFVPLGTPQNVHLVQDDSCWNSASGMTGTCHRIEFDPIPEDTVTTCVSCGTWWERIAVVNDDSVIGDEIYYIVGAWDGPLPYNPVAEWQLSYEHALATTSWMVPQSKHPLPDTLSICVGAVAWDARSYEGPGGATRYCGETSTGWRCSHLYPISETNCTTLLAGGG